MKVGEEQGEIGGELEQQFNACEEDEVEEGEEEARAESRALGRSREDGIHSHVSRSENLE